MEEKAHIAVDSILEDLTDRRGFRQAWDDCDDGIKQEITQMMYNYVMLALEE
jgi:hypothetical protein